MNTQISLPSLAHDTRTIPFEIQTETVRLAAKKEEIMATKRDPAKIFAFYTRPIPWLSSWQKVSDGKLTKRDLACYSLEKKK